MGLSDDRITLAFQLLQQPADGLRPRDRQALVANIALVRGGQASLWTEEDDPLPYGYQAGALIMLLDPPADAIGDIATIERFRAEVAMQEF